MSRTEGDVSSDAEGIGSGLQDGDVDVDSESADTQPAASETAASLPLDQVFGILKNRRRRRVLQYLDDSSDQVTLSELAEQIAAWENDKSVAQITSSERKRVYVGLYQCHLPKMDGVDGVAYNKPRGTVELGENDDVLLKYLEIAGESEGRPWQLYSVGLSLSSACVLGTALAVQSVTTVPVVGIAVALLVVMFSAYALFGVREARADDAATDRFQPE